jgi:putative oxidoreductase
MRNLLPSFPPLLARLTLGIVFVESGWGKLHALDRVTAFFTELGIPFPGLQAPFVAATELVCGLLLLVGLATRWAALPLAATMIVAVLTAQRAQIGGVGDLAGLVEVAYLALLAGLAVHGGGALSIDGLRRSLGVKAPPTVDFAAAPPRG